MSVHTLFISFYQTQIHIHLYTHFIFKYFFSIFFQESFPGFDDFHQISYAINGLAGKISSYFD